METTPQGPVILPIMAAIIAVTFFFGVLWRRQRGAIAFFEIGVVYVTVVMLYTLYPLIGFILIGLSYTPFNDSRLFLTQPTPQEIGTVGWYHVVHLVSFIAMYVIVRGKLPRAQARFRSPASVTLLIAVVLYLAISVFFLFLSLFFDLSASTYLESYLVYKRLPLILAQFAGHLSGIKLTLGLVILAMLFSNYRKYRLLILAWLVWVLLVTVFRLGSRTELVLLMFSVTLMYHYLVKPISLRAIAIVGLLGLGLFIPLGLMRSGLSLSELTSAYKPFAYSSEFESIFANAYDLGRLKAAGLIGNLPPAFYLSDLLALVPQQLLPFPKISPSVWYVTTFYPGFAAAGGGLAFGTISESVLGLGWIDLILRGAALGFILAHLQRHFATRHLAFWPFIFYIWTSVQVYQLFRGTTFFLLVFFVYRFLPVMVGIKLVSAVLKDLGQRSLPPRSGPAQV